MRMLALVLLLAAGCGGGTSRKPEPAAGELDPALDAWARGDFDAAEALLRDSKDPEAARLRARILMMRNRNREAIELLTPLLQARPKDHRGMELQQQVLPDLALAYVREDDFLRAAQIFGLMGEAILAKKYEMLGRTVAYSSNIGAEEVTAEFQPPDTLPVVAATVNGQRATLMINTLMDEIVLDRGFARRVGVEAVGLRGGGSYDEATASQVGIGNLLVKNVPIHLSDPMEIDRRRIDGVIGLQFLMHFDFTLDYRRGRLILRKAGGATTGVPAYLAGDRYLLLGAVMNGKDKTFTALGTSLKGVTLAASENYLQGAGGEIREFSAAALKLVKPSLDLKSFPAGLDGSFGVPVGFVLGHAALRGRVVRLEPRSMKVSID